MSRHAFDRSAHRPLDRVLEPAHPAPQPADVGELVGREDGRRPRAGPANLLAQRSLSLPELRDFLVFAEGEDERGDAAIDLVAELQLPERAALHRVVEQSDGDKRLVGAGLVKDRRHLDDVVEEGRPVGRAQLIGVRPGGEFVSVAEQLRVANPPNDLRHPEAHSTRTSRTVPTGRTRVLGGVLAVVAACGFAAAGAAQGAGVDLREAADRAGIRFGSAAQSSHLDDAAYADLLAAQVNTITFENEAKWGVVHPAPDRYDFTRADRLARWARSQAMRMRGHVLIWHAEMPEWLRELEPTREAAIELLRDHIETVVGHFRRKFPGLITEWDVVNEPIDNDGSRRDNLWQRWIGDDYIEHAFRFARRAAGPDVDLYVNEYFDTGLMAGAEVIAGFDDGDPVPAPTVGASGSAPCSAVIKCAAFKALVERLVARGVSVDGVGFQAHMADVAPSDYGNLTSWVGGLGLEWAITEADVPIPPTADPVSLAHQANAFAASARSCITDPACETYIVWGLADRYTWWTGLTGGALAQATPFDSALAPKPAASALEAELAAAPAAPCRERRRKGFTFAIGRGARLAGVRASVNGSRARSRVAGRRRVSVSLRGARGADVTVGVRVAVVGGGERRRVERSRDLRLCVA